MGLHRLELPCPDQSDRLGRCPRVEADNIRLAQELVNRRSRGAELFLDVWLWGRAGVEDSPLERRHEVSVAAAEATHPNDAQGPAAELQAQQIARVPPVPVPGPNLRLASPAPPGPGEGRPEGPPRLPRPGGPRPGSASGQARRWRW